MSDIQSIDDFEIIEEPTEPTREAFTVDNDEKADWAMRKLASIRRKQVENEAIHYREVKRVTEWLEKVNTDLERDASWFESNLKPYALTERYNGRKSVVLPHGTIKTTAGRPRIEISNELELLAWAETAQPDLIRTKKEIDKKSLNALITETGDVISTQGEIVPSVRVTPAETSVSFVIAD